MNKYTKQRNRGFTLIETLIAIVIFSISLVSLMAVASQGIRSSRNAKESLMAQYFAQEGVEYVRNLRDASFLSLEGISTWTDVFTGCIDTATPCAVDLLTDDLVSCSVDSICDIRKVGDQYLQNTSSGTDTGFDREIYISEIESGEVEVRAIVTWSDGRLEREVVIREYLLLWQ